MVATTKKTRKPTKPELSQSGTVVDKTPEVPELEGESKKPVQPELPQGVNSSPKVLEVPVAECESPGFRLHVDISFEGKTAAALRNLVQALQDQEVKVNGHDCRNTNDAIRWMVNQLVHA